MGRKKVTHEDQYDSPWKEAIEEYFPECLAFFFADIQADIDWSRGYQFLDKELEKIVRQALVTEQRVDKLIEVYRKSGDTAWVLIHLDIQSQHEKEFAKRMYRYNYRLFDRYDRQIVTLVIFGDESTKWRPNRYERDLWGCEVKFKFPTVKLIDYNISELEQHDNPFAVVVLAHLYTKATKNKPNERYEAKWRLIRMLYERNYTREKILSLLRYIDWLLALPPMLEQKLDDTVFEYEEAQKMAYVTSFERRAEARGEARARLKVEHEYEQKLMVMQKQLQQELYQKVQEEVQQKIQQELQQRILIAKETVMENLEFRFGEIPLNIVTLINQIDDLEVLKAVRRQTFGVESLENFQQLLHEVWVNKKPILPESHDSMTSLAV